MNINRIGTPMTALIFLFLLAACAVEELEGSLPLPNGKTASSDAPPSEPPASSEPSVSAGSLSFINDEFEANRFLTRSGWGGSKADIEALVNSDAEDWVAMEFQKSPTFTLPDVLALPMASNGELPKHQATYLYWDHIATADDELRQRMAFALSQIFVYSDVGSVGRQERRAYFQDILIRNAFGNYRDLLEEISYSPAMAVWLTYWRNRKGDEQTGRMPDENYAREILQLFSIGVVELNMDGTPKLDSQGRQIETYSNVDIIGLAKVFTGLSSKGESFWDADSDADYHALVMFEDRHSPLEKTFLGATIAPGTPGNESIQRALDTIFEHPNVAPFIARQLIQRFTASSPSPDYVERVALAFETGKFIGPNGTEFGTFERGDLSATLAAVLLDKSLFAENAAQHHSHSPGKIREPILRFMHWVNAFEVQNIDSENEYRLVSTADPVQGLGQQPFRAPSVFNFYRPGYIAPGTRSGVEGLTAPELQLLDDSSSIGYFNFMTDFAFDRSSQRNSDARTYVADYSDELLLVDDLPELVQHLNNLLTGGRMPAEERESVVYVLEALPMDDRTPERWQSDRLEIVQTAVSLVMNSPSFAVVW
ncbi:MAG: DUF1800 family protein [Pseudomonadota bacterium]